MSRSGTLECKLWAFLSDSCVITSEWCLSLSTVYRLFTISYSQIFVHFQCLFTCLENLLLEFKYELGSFL